jgi:dihydroorotase
LNPITIKRPDDWHLHLRDGEGLKAVLPFTAQRFARAIVMPNLKPPVTTTALALAYRQRILDALPAGMKFEPLMTLYLTDRTEPAEVDRAKASGIVHGFKLYPAGATTNSDAGVTDLRKIDAVLARMSEVGMILQVHGEVTNPDIDVFDREAQFIDRVLVPTVERFNKLKVVFEHITTSAAAKFVLQAREGVGATVTPQHLLMNRNDLFTGGIRPHHYCLPVLKTEPDRRALLDAIASGNPRFFLGTDSAPHARHTKETTCGCAGIFSSHAGIELYAEAFEAIGALPKLEGFASEYGADFYGLPRNSEKVRLVKQAWEVPEEFPFGSDSLVPLRAGERIAWRLDNRPADAPGSSQRDTSDPKSPNLSPERSI